MYKDADKNFVYFLLYILYVIEKYCYILWRFALLRAIIPSEIYFKDLQILIQLNVRNRVWTKSLNSGHEFSQCISKVTLKR